MKKLMNTLYITSEDSYLSLDGENIVIYEDKEEKGSIKKVYSLNKKSSDYIPL